MNQSRKKSPAEKKSPNSHRDWVVYKKERNREQYQKRTVCHFCKRDIRSHHFHCQEK